MRPIARTRAREQLVWKKAEGRQLEEILLDVLVNAVHVHMDFK